MINEVCLILFVPVFEEKKENIVAVLPVTKLIMLMHHGLISILIILHFSCVL